MRLPVVACALFNDRLAATPVVESSALRFGDSSPESVLRSVFLNDDRTYESCIEAVRSPDPDSLLRTLPCFVPPADCAALRAYCDARVDSQVALDNVDRLPDFQVNLDSLDGVVQRETADKLMALPSLFGARAARVGIFVRRYTPQTRCYFPFHVDGNLLTANVALSPRDAYQGGHLRCLVDGGIQTLVRDEGDVTVHRNSICHAVAPVDSGTRHSLLIFFHAA